MAKAVLDVKEFTL